MAKSPQSTAAKDPAAEFTRRYGMLNPKQREVVEAIKGPVMVIAGPGTGKTEILAMRVGNILRKDEDVAPSEILCLTFTDAAAWNMRKRLAEFVGRDAYRVAIHTFHSFGAEIINRYPERFYGGAAFSPADDITQIEILESIFKEMDHDDPLKARDNNNRFVYLYPARQAIDSLKKAGLTPEEFEAIISNNETTAKEIEALIAPVFGERVSKKLMPQMREALGKIRSIKTGPLPGGFRSLPVALGNSLEEALDEVDATGKTSALTAWKSRWTEKGEDEKTHFADSMHAEKILSFARLYRAYCALMHKEGYFDFNDMILDVLAAFKKDPALRAEIAERYNYILVDEFQDTNNAQLQLVECIAAYHGSGDNAAPNVMAVGDDDQAIFKFQGAEIENILQFTEKFPNTQFIVLPLNYRSTQEILDLARRVITRGTNRLERVNAAIKKNLIASGDDIGSGAIKGYVFPSRALEYQWIVDEIQRLIGEGMMPKEIAVIARKHDDLQEIAGHFHRKKLPVAYEKEENVLQVEPVRELMVMAEFVDSIMRRAKDRDDLLHEILNYPFWGLSHIAIWELSLKAHKAHKPWLQVMRESGGELEKIAHFFIALGAKAATSTAEEVLHELIGGPQLLLPDEENGEDDEPWDARGADGTHEVPPQNADRDASPSPFRSFYFGAHAFNGDRAEYLRFLSALRSFITALRAYHMGKRVSTADMIEFVKMHEANGMTINTVNVFANADNAVQLMSAHKSKGLEFGAVFVINCEERVWAKARGGIRVPLPSNLPIAPARDDRDDHMRLFYVALTRAKRLLYLTSAATNEKGKEVDGLSFLVAEEGEAPFFEVKEMERGDFADAPEHLLIGQLTAPYLPVFAQDERALLAPVVERYALSVTHLHNFLDVVHAGPRAFFERNLLKFPEPLSASSAFGSAVHETIKAIYVAVKNGGTLPSEGEVMAWFEQYLVRQGLNDHDFQAMLKRGTKALPPFYARAKNTFSPDDISERDFHDQGVMIGSAPLTGKIDRMTINEKEKSILVGDFKTGRALSDWKPNDDRGKIKAWKYRGQLAFYKLLVEHSREFGGAYTMDRGVIQFVEPRDIQPPELLLTIEPSEVDRLKTLIGIVYQKIQNLDFPNTNAYSKDFRGIQSFEEDLLSGNA